MYRNLNKVSTEYINAFRQYLNDYINEIYIFLLSKYLIKLDHSDNKLLVAMR